jgi:uncharacterized protein
MIGRGGESGATARAAICAVAVMAKAPQVGDVKTRLVPPLSPAEAAELGGCFLRDIAENILLAAERAAIHGFVAYSPVGAENVLRPLLPPQIGLVAPRRNGLGASLCDAAADLLAAGYGAACLVNADSPTLPTAVLVAAAEALGRPGDRVVLGPAEDGGYYLIGLKRPHPRLFEGMAWSTSAVLRQTCERAASLGLETVLLPAWYDIDDPASLRTLLDELAGAAPPGRRAGYPAPHTAGFLRRLAAADGGRLARDPAAGIGGRR